VSLGLIARADDGGLGAQTWELWAHLHPEKTLVVLADHQTRGQADPSRFDGCGEVRVTPASPTKSDAMWLTAGVDTIYSAEGWYGHRLWMQARRRQVKLVLQANPEMFAGEPADEMIAPTPWRMDVLPSGTRVMPFPVASERFTQKPAGEVRRLYHVHSSAMCDRNGTELVLAAAQLMRRRCELIIRGGDARRETVGRVDVTWLGHQPGLYHEAWPDVDALILPRRYGGLCLPMQEAAAIGLPIVSLDLEPQSRWLDPAAMIRAKPTQLARMRGGKFPVHSGKPAELAAVLDRLVTDAGFAANLAERSRAWAADIDWKVMAPKYESLLR